MKLENDDVVVVFCEKGGEIASFINKKTGIEYMWQGDEAYWTGKNPILFPMVGNTYTKQYEIKGKQYAMKNHGLLRYVTFNCIKETPDEVIMEYITDANALLQYPFPFVFHVIYTLEGCKLTIRYEIKNTGTEEMPFIFGLHPGFNCPLTKHESFEDYRLVFDQEENLQQLIISDQGEKGLEYTNVKQKEIMLCYDEIERYGTLIYKGMHSSYVTLKGKEHGVRLSIGGYPLLAIWTAKKKAPFICIEPWYGHGDFYDCKDDFYHREGTMILKEGHTFTTSYSIEVF